MSINHEQPLDLGVVYIVYRKHHSHPTTRTSHVFQSHLVCGEMEVFKTLCPSITLGFPVHGL